MLRVAYRVIPCRVYLSQLKVVDSELCNNCNRRDDLLHFFYECPAVRPFWSSLTRWIHSNSEISFFPSHIAEEELLLGLHSGTRDFSLVNYIMMWAKFFIYKNTIFGQGEYDFLQFLLELKNRMAIERLCCFSDNSYHRRFKKWEKFYNSF